MSDTNLEYVVMALENIDDERVSIFDVTASKAAGDRHAGIVSEIRKRAAEVGEDGAACYVIIRIGR